MPEEAHLQVARILAMASWIKDNPGHNVRQIAQHFGRTSRQVRRDIEYMGQIGDSMVDRSYAIDWDLYEEQGVVVIRGHALPALPDFTPAEAAHLLVILRALAPHLSADEQDTLLTLALKLAYLTRDHALHTDEHDTESEEDEIREIISVAENSSGDLGRVAVFREAITEQREVFFNYIAHGKADRRRVYPLGLRHVSDVWLLDAWDPERGIHRSYRLDRMEDIDVGQRRPRVAIPQPFAPQSLTLTITAKARWVCEDYECTILQDADDRITFSLPVWSQDWVSALLCDISADIIECPREWRIRAQRHAQESLAIWDDVQRLRSGE